MNRAITNALNKRLAPQPAAPVYRCYVVRQSVYDATPLGTEWQGGKVVEGIYDDELDHCILIVRVDKISD